MAVGAAAHMKAKYSDLVIAGSEDGNPKALSQKLKEAKPNVILVAFGAPTQEFWIDQFKSEIPSLKLAIGIGGTFDFWSGKATRAPKIMQSLGLEWLWRLITEPRKRAIRIWRAVVVFSVLVLKEKFIK